MMSEQVQQEMAIIAEAGDSTGRMGMTTTNPIDVEEDSGILSLSTKGPGRAIKILGVNADIEDTKATLFSPSTSPLHGQAVPDLVCLQKKQYQPEVKTIEPCKVADSHIPKENKRSSLSIVSQPDQQHREVRSLQPRHEPLDTKSLPPKKRNLAFPYHQSPRKSQDGKTHDSMVKRDLTRIKEKTDGPTVNPAGELKLLLDIIVKSYIENKMPININNQPHHLMAIPVGDVEEQGTADADLYDGIVDRPPPAESNHEVTGHEIVSDENALIERDKSTRKLNIVPCEGVSGTKNHIHLQNAGHQHLSTQMLPTSVHAVQANPALTAEQTWGDPDIVHGSDGNGEPGPYSCDDQPLDLSMNTTSTCKTETDKYITPGTSFDSRSPTTVFEEDGEEMEVETVPVEIYQRNTDEMANLESETKAFSQENLTVMYLLAELNRLKMKTPEPMAFSNHHVEKPIASRPTHTSYGMSSLPEQQESIPRIMHPNFQGTSSNPRQMHPIPEEINRIRGHVQNIPEQVTAPGPSPSVLASLPNLASLEMTNIDGSVIETKGERVKRSLRAKLTHH